MACRIRTIKKGLIRYRGRSIKKGKFKAGIITAIIIVIAIIIGCIAYSFLSRRGSITEHENFNKASNGAGGNIS